VRFLVLYLGMCMLTALPLRAQEREQTKHAAASGDLVEVGKAAYADARYADALRAFEEAYQKVKRPRTLYRIGDTADKLGMHARAVAALEEYLRVVPAATDRIFIESRIAANRQQAAADLEAKPAAASVATKPQPSAAEPNLSTGASAQPLARAPQKTMPTPAPAAAVAGDESTKSKPTDDGGLKPWWIIAGAGTLVVAGIMVIALTVGASGAHSTPQPVKGNIGGSVQTLGGP
jgi:hypothetical protein